MLCYFSQYYLRVESIITLSAGAIVGFTMQSHEGSEGGTVNVCVTILSPNQTVLDMSTVRGEFSISGSDGNSTASPHVLLLESLKCICVYRQSLSQF